MRVIREGCASRGLDAFGNPTSDPAEYVKIHDYSAALVRQAFRAALSAVPDAGEVSEAMIDVAAMKSAEVGVRHLPFREWLRVIIGAANMHNTAALAASRQADK